MRAMVIPVVVHVLRMTSKGLEKDRRNWKSEEELKPSRQ